MAARNATLYRMVLPDHVCPFGVRALQMLQQHGYEVEDCLLETRMEVDAFMEKHDVPTTPQVFIDGKHVGGSNELERYLAEEQARA